MHSGEILNAMNKFIFQFIFFPLLFLSVFVSGTERASAGRIPFYTQKDLTVHLDSGWRYSKGDSIEMASIGYDDSNWDTVETRLPMFERRYAEFNGTAWFRLHFRLDSSLHRKLLAIFIDHPGTSVLYLDGKKLEDWDDFFGDEKEYINPANYPFMLPELDSGMHVMAVRYTNQFAKENNKSFNEPSQGFRIKLGLANEVVRSNLLIMVIRTGITTALGFIFLAFTLLHFLMWIFYRREKSNLHFSFFTFFLGVAFLIPMVNGIIMFPKVQMFLTNLFFPLLLFIFLSLHYFILSLYRLQKNWIHKIVLLDSALIVLHYIINKLFPNTYLDADGFLILMLITIVLCRTIFVIIRSIYKKEPGARIIGIGMLFFVVFILSLILAGFIIHEINLSLYTFIGRLVTILAGMAILSVPVSMSAYLSWNNARINRDLIDQLNEIQLLSARTIEQEQEKNKLVQNQNEMLERKVNERTKELSDEKKKSDDLLLNILPEEVAQELKDTGKATARLFNHVTVLFTDFVNFTGISETLTPSELVTEIDRCFKAFDEIMEKHGLEKIKTIGDAYLAVSGLPVETTDHAIRAIHAATEITEWMKNSGSKFSIRIGMNSGPVVAGIVGVKKYAYDIWGDTVNTASRMESNGEVGRINISGTTFAYVQDQIHCIHRGKIAVKGKGEVDMYFVA
jgi:class 3 adenylate cyclase